MLSNQGEKSVVGNWSKSLRGCTYQYLNPHFYNVSVTVFKLCISHGRSKQTPTAFPIFDLPCISSDTFTAYHSQRIPGGQGISLQIRKLRPRESFNKDVVLGLLRELSQVSPPPSWATLLCFPSATFAVPQSLPLLTSGHRTLSLWNPSLAHLHPWSSHPVSQFLIPFFKNRLF